MRKDPPPLLFDLVFEKPELTKSARDSWTRVKRDTLNPTQLSRGRTWGTYKTTVRAAGVGWLSSRRLLSQGPSGRRARV